VLQDRSTRRADSARSTVNFSRLARYRGSPARSHDSTRKRSRQILGLERRAGGGLARGRDFASGCEFQKSFRVELVASLILSKCRSSLWRMVCTLRRAGYSRRTLARPPKKSLLAIRFIVPPSRRKSSRLIAAVRVRLEPELSIAQQTNAIPLCRSARRDHTHLARPRCTRLYISTRQRQRSCLCEHSFSF
jgi:hypothetical protein